MAFGKLFPIKSCKRLAYYFLNGSQAPRRRKLVFSEKLLAKNVKKLATGGLWFPCSRTILPNCPKISPGVGNTAHG
jgi:hypothetical protein